MSYVYIISSEDSRDLADRARSYLEAAGITTWLRDPQLDPNNPAEKQFLETASRSAAAMLVIWRTTSDASTESAAHLRLEVKDARARGQRVLVVRDEDELPNLVAHVAQIVQPERDASPLPIPMIDEEAEKISAFVSSMRRPSGVMVLGVGIGGIGLVALLVLIFVLQSPGGMLNPPTSTPSTTPSPTVTPTFTHTFTTFPTRTNTPTVTETASTTRTPTPTISSTASPTDTASPTATRTATASPTATPSMTRSLQRTATYTASRTRSSQPSATPTATPELQISPTQAMSPTVLSGSSEATADPFNQIVTNTPRPNDIP